MSGKVIAVRHTGVSVRDLGRSLAFYCDGLELTVEERPALWL
jgi:catechol 2,3-dioxygenase-like lactoylglutathione lyase family enzyme